MGEPAAEGAPEDVEEEQPEAAAAPGRRVAWRLPVGVAITKQHSLRPVEKMLRSGCAFRGPAATSCRS